MNMHFSLGMTLIAALSATGWAASGAEGGAATVNVQHVKIYYEKGRFGGWPANYGMWNWDNEILVGFSRGYYRDLGPTRHHIDREKPEEHWLARSLDGGETWSLEYPPKKANSWPRGRPCTASRRPDCLSLKCASAPAGLISPIPILS